MTFILHTYLYVHTYVLLFYIHTYILLITFILLYVRNIMNKNVYNAKKKLFFVKIGTYTLFSEKNPIIRIFDYPNGVRSQLIRIIGVLLYWEFSR